jgi:hypothetical protein
MQGDAIMKLLRDVFLTDSIEVSVSPDKVFDFLHNLVDDESYRSWHPADHVTWRWLRGSPWQEGSIGYAEEYFDGKLHKLKFIVTKVIPGNEIAYAPFSRLLRRYIPKMGFSVATRDAGCIFTATIHGRLPWLPRLFAKKRLEQGLASVKRHMKEEGENLKKILEYDNGT